MIARSRTLRDSLLSKLVSCNLRVRTLSIAKRRSLEQFLGIATERAEFWRNLWQELSSE
jgi:hypothetical protein